MDLKKLKKAIDNQKDIIIDKLADRSLNNEELSEEEIEMMENYYNEKKGGKNE